MSLRITRIYMQVLCLLDLALSLGLSSCQATCYVALLALFSQKD